MTVKIGTIKVALIFTLFFFIVPVYAQTTAPEPSNPLQQDSTIEAIPRLLAQVLELNQKITALGGTPIAIPPSLASFAQGSGGNAEGVSTACSIQRTLSLGSRGDDVACLQRFLIAQNLLAPDSATGYFGRLTQAAVKQLQAQHNLEQVGIVGRLTRGIINAASTPDAQAPITPTPSVPQPPVTPPVSYGDGGGGSVTPPVGPPPPSAPCTFFNGQAIPSGQSVTAYQSSSVSFGQQCVSEQRMCSNGALSGSYMYAVCGVANLGPLVVNPSSRVVVMEYEAWFNPLWNASGQVFGYYDPLLSSSNVSKGYDSTDPSVLDQHVKWLTDLGVDAVIGEQTNGGPCAYGDAQACAAFLRSIGNPGTPADVASYTKTINAINNGTLNLYPAFEKRGAAIKIIPMVDGQDVLMYQPRGDGKTPFDAQIEAYQAYINQYPDLSVIYQGKPLLLVFLGSSQTPNDPNSAYNQARLATQKWQNIFTIRLMAGFIDSQPTLWGKAFGLGGAREVRQDYGLWTWIDRYNPLYNLIPSYATAGNRAEAFTVTSAANGTDPRNYWGYDATLYHGGATYDAFFAFAKQLDPIFLIFNQFNEFAGPGAGSPDEGPDIEHSNDIEPTKQWGSAKFDVAKQYIHAYRSGDAPPAPADPKTSFISDLYQCILGRVPSAGEIATWKTASSSAKVGWFYHQFFESDEYVSASTTSDRYVRQMYQCVLGRSGSAPEFAPWVAALDNKGYSRAQELDIILGSSEFRQYYGSLISEDTGYPL